MKRFSAWKARIAAAVVARVAGVAATAARINLQMKTGGEITYGALKVRSAILTHVAVWFITLATPYTVARTCQATTITYSQFAHASGSLGGTSFTNAPISLIATADTFNIASYTHGIRVLNQSLTVEVAGAGLAIFTVPTFTFVHISDSAVGFTNASLKIDLLDTINTSLASYDLSSAVGPVAGAAVFNAGMAFATDQGSFIINSVSGDITFQANLSAVPEIDPAGMGSALALVAGTVGLLERRRLRAA